MDLELTGKVAIVGGASKGLGRACAQVLADEGAKLALCSRSQKDLDKAAQEIHDTARADVLAFAGDLDRPETVRDLVAATVGRFGRLDILVNNSGGPPLARAHTATEEQWATALQRSLLFFARMSREAVPHLKQAGGGRIVNILASTVYQPIPNLALSGATRMGVVAFAKSLADEVGRDGGRTHRRPEGDGLSGGVSRVESLQLHHRHHAARRRRAGALGAVGASLPVSAWASRRRATRWRRTLCGRGRCRTASPFPPPGADRPRPRSAHRGWTPRS